MSTYTETIGGRTFTFHGLVDLMAKATPQRSGDELAGCAAESETERVAAWLERPGVRLMEVQGEWSWPINSGVCASALPRHLLG